MENRDTALCQGLADYMTGEMSDVERKRFERHLDTCAACREDAAEWRLVWDRLAEEAPQLELPADLKEEVLGAVFGSGQSRSGDSASPARAFSTVPSRGTAWRRLAVIMAVVAAFAAGFVLRGPLSSSLMTAPAPAASASVSEIERIYRLTPASEASPYLSRSGAYGVACLMNNGGERSLAVYVFGTAKTEGDQVYHVWLLRDGKRDSAGTFKVGSSGVGLLTVPWTDRRQGFDQVGITLEQNGNTTSPQGPKIFGSADAAEG
ncbi:anti-sigma factor [Cohnella caldifontis]|uniref:anti-sigma factor n=1 Tax=Cohnella caldifontis TaxID=3027471 RepID=UPI0023EBB9DA|nr:anti-sigma factor [Cohnella sp. YIM B05605]